MHLNAALDAHLDYRIVTWTSPVYGDNDQPTYPLAVEAPEGMKVVGGGWKQNSEPALYASYPSEDGSAWHFVGTSLYGSVTLYAVCVSAG